jgi:ABC-type sugar transport system substrate-binding protein
MRLSTITAVLVGSALALTACGGSSGGSTPTTGSGVDTAGVAAAQAVVDKYTTNPRAFPTVTPLKAKPTGKKFAYVACSAPECIKMGDFIKEAAGLLGATVKQFNGGATAQTISAAFDSALQSNPDVLMAVAFEPASWSAQLTKAKARHIPVLAWSITTQPAATAVDATYNGTPEFIELGTVLADWAIADSKGTADAVVVWPPAIGVITPVADGVKAEFAKHCTSCSIDGIEVPVTDLGTPRIPNRIVSYLQQHPKVKYVITGFGSMNLGVADALKAAGLSGIKLYTQGGSPSEYQAVKDGQQAVILAKDLNMEGWVGVDTAAKLATGQTPDRLTPPFQFLGKDDLTFDISQAWVAYPDFKDRFKKSWGLT